MRIYLTRSQIKDALPKVSGGLRKYLSIQEFLSAGVNRTNSEAFERSFVSYYKVRRAISWRKTYFALLLGASPMGRNKSTNFQEVLNYLHRHTGRVEASFSSKLVATIDPNQPVIDSVVLGNLGARLPFPYKANRLLEIGLLYDRLRDCFVKFLGTEDGEFLVSEFKSQYPEFRITNIKMLDFILWQTRPPKSSRVQKLRH
jgi:hypothetical protein